MEIKSQSSNPDTRNMRYVTVHGTVYFRAEDVISYIMDIASTEETDVKNRFELAAKKIQAMITK